MCREPEDSYLDNGWVNKVSGYILTVNRSGNGSMTLFKEIYA